MKQITLPDQRYYRRNGKYYPSITYVLSSFPKGKFYETWLKDHGHTSEYIAKQSASEGTQVHKLIEDYLKLIQKYQFRIQSPNTTLNPWIIK